MALTRRAYPRERGRPLSDPASYARTRVLTGDLAEGAAQLKDEPGAHILAQGVLPVALGSGDGPFTWFQEDLHLELPPREPVTRADRGVF